MTQKLCAWCSAPAVGEKLVQRALIKKTKGGPVVIESERHSPACAEHMGIPEAEEPTVVRARGAAISKSWKSKQERLV